MVEKRIKKGKHTVGKSGSIPNWVTAGELRRIIQPLKLNDIPRDGRTLRKVCEYAV